MENSFLYSLFVFTVFNSDWNLLLLMSETEINRKITAAWKAFWNLKFNIFEKSYKPKSNIRSLRFICNPCTTLRQPTWTLTHKLKTALQVCQIKWVYQYGARSAMNFAVSSLHPLDALERDTSTKWRYGRRLVQMDSTRLAHTVKMWNSCLGRPRLRLADMFTVDDQEEQKRGNSGTNY